MILGLVMRGLRVGKARFVCAALGIALAVGSLVFMTSLVATNNAQAPDAARKACAPWVAWKIEGIELRRGPRSLPTKIPSREGNVVARRPSESSANLVLDALLLTIDYRPGGHVLQGPPMMALMAQAPDENPYGAVKLIEGRWVDETSGEREIVCVKAGMRRFTAAAPKLGETLKFVGREGTMSAKIVGYLDGLKLPREFPYVFANRAAFGELKKERHGEVSFFKEMPTVDTPGLLRADSESVISSFKADEQKRMDFAKPLLLLAAFMTALSLLVNSLLLSVEANRSMLAKLRVLGMTRAGVVGFVTMEAVVSSIVGWIVGVLGAAGALAAWVAFDAASFPAGMALDLSRIRLTLFILPLIVVLSVLFALRPALKVRPMDVAVRRPVSRRLGMTITFACGFAAFVAVEVWGASLMRAFVPSVEWPDAIVSILPGGVSSYDVEKLRTVEGVRRISELVPRQCLIAGKERSNALFLAAEWLPKFNFIEGAWEEAEKAILSSDAVVITEMMSNAHALHKGDRLEVMVGGRRGPAEKMSFPIVGVVDLNWHMVTSRGLVRGLNGASPMTDGPVFCSFDTIGLIDPRTYIVEPAMSAPMTHLWVEYESAFLAKHGVFPAGRLIESEIAKRLGNPDGSTVRLHARDEIADGTLAHGSDLIGQAARVPFVFLAILAIGFVAMLVAEADARRREFVTLRAVGATKVQLAGRLATSAVKTAFVGILFGLPSGSLIGWLFTFKTGNWPGLPHWFVLPVGVTVEGALGALVFALIFALPTAWMLISRDMRRQTHKLLKPMTFALCLTVMSFSAVAAEYRLAPKGHDDMTSVILETIAKVKASKKGGAIVLEAGDYYLRSPIKSDIWVSNHDNPRPRQIFLPIAGVTNLTIRCEKGARLVADGEGICLALIDTKNVKIEGVACDYARPFFSIWTLKDGKLVADDKNYPYELQGRTIFTTGRGWREKQIICELFDKDTHVFRGSTWWDGSIDRVFGGHPDGTLAMTRSPYRPNPCVFLYRAHNSVFIRCGAYSAAGMGFIAQRSENVLLDGWRTHSTRPIALQADATHFSNCRGHVKVVNSTFEGMVDDAINVHSTSLKIIAKPDENTLVCQYVHRQSVGFEVFLPDETLRFIKGSTFEPGAEVKVAATKMLAHNKVEIRLAQPTPQPYGVGDAVENADWQPRVTFSKNTVRNSSPRATLFTTPGKVICADNLFENVAGQPIYFAGDAWDWYESGASRDVLVRGNTFRHCGFKSGRGMIQIEPAVHDLKAQKDCYHRNIRVEDNLFEDFTLPLVWARSAENVRLMNNRIVRGNDRLVKDHADVIIINPTAK